MYATWNSSSSLYVPPKHIYTCMESTRPPGPSLVENITVIACSIDGSNMTLYMQWSPPTVYNGELDFYDLCIGGAPLMPDEEIPNSGDYDCSTLNVCCKK